MIDREDRWTIMFLAFGGYGQNHQIPQLHLPFVDCQKDLTKSLECCLMMTKKQSQKFIHTKIHNEKKTLDYKEVNPFVFIWQPNNFFFKFADNLRAKLESARGLVWVAEGDKN